MDSHHRGKENLAPIYATHFTYADRAKQEQGWRCPHCGAKLKMSFTMHRHLQLSPDCQRMLRKLCED